MALDLVVAGLLTASGISYGLLGMRLMRAPREPGQLSLALVGIGIGVWVLGGAVQAAADSYLVFSLGRLCHFFGTGFVPVGLLVAFRAYSGSSTSQSTIILLLCLPVFSMLVAGTNQYHQLMWSMPDVNDAGQMLARPTAWGPWFLFLHAPFTYFVTGMAILQVLMHSSNVRSSRRTVLVAFSAAALVPVSGLLAFDLGLGTHTVPYVPMVFATMLPVFAWLILGERAIEFSPISFETVFNNMADPVVVLDGQGRIVSLNQGAEKLLNVSETGAFRQSLEDLFGDDHSEVFEAMKTNEPRRITTRTGRFLHVQSSPIQPDGSTIRAGRVLLFRDVSDVEHAQAELRSSQVLLRTLFDHSVNGLVRLRWRKETEESPPELVCVSANAAAARFLEASADAVSELSAGDLIALATGGMTQDDAEAVRDMFDAAVARGEVVDTEVRPLDGPNARWLRMIGEPVGDNVAVTFIDVTSNKAREEQMESMAATDPLTGVLNRRGFEQEASAKLHASTDDSTGALLFIDLNEFKTINDRCGHDIGDELLRVAADRLRVNLRSCDIVGRPGGDEFVALVPDVSPEIAETLAERLAEALEQPYRVGEDTLLCSACIGLALYPEHAETLTGLLRAADQAMYRAKARINELDVTVRKRLLEKAV